MAPLRLRDPLAELLGAVPEGCALEYTFADAVKVVGHLTGAASDTGFHGLAGRFARAGLLTFHPETPALATFELERTDTRAAVRVSYSPDSVPPAPEMRQAMAGALAGDPSAGASFRRLWLDRVRRSLEASGHAVAVSALGVLPGADG